MAAWSLRGSYVGSELMMMAGRLLFHKPLRTKKAAHELLLSSSRPAPEQLLNSPRAVPEYSINRSRAAPERLPSSP